MAAGVFFSGYSGFCSKAVCRNVVLADGSVFAKLTIGHKLGVSTEITYKIKRIDSDFFAEDLD